MTASSPRAAAMPGWAAHPEPPTIDDLPDLALADPADDPVKRYYLQRLAGGIPRGFRLMAPLVDEETRRYIDEIDAAFRALPAEQRLAAVDHPIVHFEWFKLLEHVRDGNRAALVAAIRDIGRLFLVPLLREGLADGLSLPVRTHRGEIRFPGHRVHIRLSDNAANGPGEARVDGPDLVVAGSSWRGRVRIEDLLQPAGRAAPGDPMLCVRRAVPGSDIELDGADPAVRQLFASMNRKPREEAEPVYDLEIMPDVPDNVAGAFGDALSFLGAVKPGLTAEIASYTKLIVPYHSRSISTFTENAFMGAVFMSESYRPFSSLLFTAEHLLHEHSHLRLALVMEIDSLFWSAGEAAFLSPWRRDKRPLVGLVQGAFVFARIANFLNLAAERTGDAAFAERRAEIIPELVAAVEVLTGEGVEHTPLGLSLLEQYRAEIGADPRR